MTATITIVAGYSILSGLAGYCWPPVQGHTGDRAIAGAITGGAALVAGSLVAAAYHLIF